MITDFTFQTETYYIKTQILLLMSGSLDARTAGYFDMKSVPFL